jgi:ketosteroid isomerase-like protein
MFRGASNGTPDPNGCLLPGSNAAQGYDESVIVEESPVKMLWILLLCPMAHAACPTAQPKNENALIQIEQTWARALEQHDVQALDCILADEFEDADPDGKLSDRKATLSKAAGGPSVHHELSDLHAQLYGDFGYTRGLATAMNPQTKMITQVRFTDVYVFRDGHWQCVAGHESLVNTMLKG